MHFLILTTPLIAIFLRSLCDMMYSMMKSLVFLIVVSMMVTACKTKTPKPFGKDPALEGKKWELIELNGKAFTPVAGGKAIDLVFEGQSNTFGGSAGCNQCNGMYTTQDEMIKLHKMAVTMMACPDMSVEQTYLEKMDQINKYKLVTKKVNGVKTEMLQLFIDDTLVAQFKATPIQ